MEFNQSRFKSESERLERMASQLLNVASIEGGRRKLFMEPLSLAVSLSRVTGTNFNARNENGNALTLEIPEGLPDVAADPDAILQIASNLLSNAVRHSQNGTIAVSLTAGNGSQTVRLSDNGEVMPQKIQEQEFSRYIERESHVTGRSGMGLHICKKLIDAHGGEIGIDGDPGKGAAAWFTIHNAQLNLSFQRATIQAEGVREGSSRPPPEWLPSSAFQRPASLKNPHGLSISARKSKSLSTLKSPRAHEPSNHMRFTLNR